MSGNIKTILLGYSGHGYVVAEAALLSKIVLKYYSESTEMVINPFGLIYVGDEGSIEFSEWGKGNHFIIGIGDNAIREKIALNLRNKKEIIVSVVHPNSSVSGKAHLGEGVFISRNVSINPLAVIGDFSIINTGSIIEHECKIAKSVHIGPGVVLAGNVKIGDRTFVGANSVIKQGISIGKDVIIGAGSVVIRDISNGSIFAGNPAKHLK